MSGEPKSPNNHWHVRHMSNVPDQGPSIVYGEVRRPLRRSTSDTLVLMHVLTVSLPNMESDHPRLAGRNESRYQMSPLRSPTAKKIKTLHRESARASKRRDLDKRVWIDRLTRIVGSIKKKQINSLGSHSQPHGFKITPWNFGKAVQTANIFRYALIAPRRKGGKLATVSSQAPHFCHGDIQSARQPSICSVRTKQNLLRHHTLAGLFHACLTRHPIISCHLFRWDPPDHSVEQSKCELAR